MPRPAAFIRHHAFVPAALTPALTAPQSIRLAPPRRPAPPRAARAPVRRPARLTSSADALEHHHGLFTPAAPHCGDSDGAPLAPPSHVCEAAGDAAAQPAPAWDGPDDTPGSSGGVPGGGGGGGGGGGEDKDDASLPDDVRAALAAGLVGRDAVARYRAAAANPALGALLSVGAFRSRFLADPAFLFKLLVQELVGNGTALASEIAVRGREIVHELEYVASDLIVGTVVEASFVWVLAPQLSSAGALSSSSSSWLARAIAALPSHLFQPDSAARTFTLSQRVGSFAFGAAQYGAIGLAAGLVGTAITYALLEARKAVDKGYVPERPQPAVLPNAAGWAAFMVLSANTRFQLVEGLELGVARAFAGNDQVRNLGIIALRLANNYWGGVQFVKFFRFLGLHATGDEDGGAHGDKGAAARELDEKQ